MKRISGIISATLVLSLSLCLSACSGNEKAEEKPSQKTEIQQTANTDGYKSEKYNLQFTPPEGYTMFNNEMIDAQAVGQTKYEMVSEHSTGYPRVMVIAETSEASDVDAYLENLRSVVSSVDFTLSDISDCEIAGRNFRYFSAERTDGTTQTFYAEKCGDEFVCISVADLKDFPTHRLYGQAFRPDACAYGCCRRYPESSRHLREMRKPCTALSQTFKERPACGAR